ncbi:hypothetical protein AYX19_08755 [Paenarthrobacter ureafaciens]|nr:hypothetical protein AYX19_08755 [Paenarthrobacter ureafaciens]
MTPQSFEMVRVWSSYDEAVEVTLTVENTDGEQGSVATVGPDYETALASAQALIPEDAPKVS